MKFWIAAFRCWINRPSWEEPPLGHEHDWHLFTDEDKRAVHLYCDNCGGFVQDGRHHDMFAGVFPDDEDVP